MQRGEKSEFGYGNWKPADTARVGRSSQDEAGHKKDQNCVMCRDVDGPRDCHRMK